MLVFVVDVCCLSVVFDVVCYWLLLISMPAVCGRDAIVDVVVV